MPCICLPCRGLRRALVESYVKAFFGLFGILGEIITGLKFNYIPTMNKDNAEMFGCGELMPAHKHIHNHPTANATVEAIHFERVNAQHIVMYSGKLFKVSA